MLAVMAGSPLGVAAQDAQPTPPPTPTPIKAIDTADIADRAEDLRRDLNRMVPRETDSAAVETAEGALPELKTLIDTLRVRLDEALKEPASLRVLKDERVAWASLAARLKVLDDGLERQARDISHAQSRLGDLGKEWSETLETTAERGDPPLVRKEIREAVDAISQAGDLLKRRLDPILDAQARLGVLRRDVVDALERIDQRVTVFGRDILRPDSAPVWRALNPEATQRFHHESLMSTARVRVNDLKRYVAFNGGLFGLQLLAWLILGVWLTSIRRHYGKPELQTRTAENAVLRAPFTVALLVAITIGVPFHTGAPRAWPELLYVVILAALTRLAVAALPRRTAGAVIALSCLAFLHWMGYVVPDVHPIDRWLWLAVSGLGAVLVPLFAKRVMTVFGDGTRLWAAVRSRLATAVTAMLALSAIANVLGLVDLAVIVTDGIMVSLYVAAVMWTLTRILDGITGLSLRAGWAQRSRIVRDHGDRLRAELHRVVRLFAVVVWLISTLDAFLMWTPIARTLQSVLGASFAVGSLTISLGSVLAAGVAVWLALELSRLVRFFFEEEVASRIALPPGVPATMSRLIHYTIIVIGLVLALAAAGIQLGQLAIVVGAFGVGIGFGLQTIVNNFISGLILMFERPIRVGDVVQLGAVSGEVASIGIRASTIRGWDGSEVVVPNGNLISNELTNWTLSNAIRRLEIPVGVAYGTDPERVIELLTDEMKAHEHVLTEPEPVALFVGFGDSSLNFSARCWCRFTDSLSTSSRLHVAFNRALAEADIEIPFPQRDLHLRSVDPDATLAGVSDRQANRRPTSIPATGEAADDE